MEAWRHARVFVTGSGRISAPAVVILHLLRLNSAGGGKPVDRKALEALTYKTNSWGRGSVEKVVLILGLKNATTQNNYIYLVYINYIYLVYMPNKIFRKQVSRFQNVCEMQINEMSIGSSKDYNIFPAI